ncbi:hypothetical protein J4470_04795 [Candidatus Woesearchaeota archaeon]|nr:hypothetical protein [Candidatus Woesearchaeota archaeon]
MKITIDTKEDSHDEIRKIVNMLNSLIEANLAEQSEQSSEPQPIVGEGIFGMFSGNREEEAPAAMPETPSGSEVEGMLAENREESVDLPEPKVIEDVKRHSDDEPRIVPY